ncbi:hypothetical protein GCM10022415_12200 [Knoellia locipacati]|uniref:Uncharacterized protein n=1 Tax=Knoellia locipacati TaxID=882824 RepID=A0A512SYX6_9MICO|nr:hypothetical protein KLO01_12170 [Knoellia locipacati]
MGTAGRSTLLAAVVRAETAPTSVTDPQAWHSPQRPTHLTVVHPHSVHRYAGRAPFAAMAANLGDASDSALRRTVDVPAPAPVAP